MKKLRLSFQCVFWAIFCAGVKIESTSQELGDLDVMTDFGYLISPMQAMRQSVYQAVYALQHQDHASAISLLQDAQLKLESRLLVSEDDMHAIQAMLDKINGLIETLEAQDRAIILSLCQQIQGQL